MIWTVIQLTNYRQNHRFIHSVKTEKWFVRNWEKEWIGEVTGVEHATLTCKD